MAKGKGKPSSGGEGIKPAEVAKQIKALLKEVPEIRADAARLDELRRIFTRLESAGELTFTTEGDSNSDKKSVAAKWASFLKKSHGTMVSQLCERVKLGRHASIRCLWGVIAGSPRTSTAKMMSTGNKQQPSPLSHKFVNIDILKSWMWAVALQESNEMDKGMRHMIEAEFFSPYRDVQYFSLGVITKLATAAYDSYYDGEADGSNDDDENAKKTRIGGKLLELLMMIPVPSCDEDLESRKQFLFPPPLHVSPSDNIEIDEEEADDESENGDSDSDSDEESSSDGEGSKVEETGSRPKKRQKPDNARKFAFQQMRMFRREYKKAWLAVLMLPLPVASLKKALHILPRNVLNYVAEPLRFADFFMQAYSDHSSGIIGVLALDGLFLLITKCKFLLRLIDDAFVVEVFISTFLNSFLTQ